ncbi:MAG: ComF family protein [Micrococcales bacterium]
MSIAAQLSTLLLPSKCVICNRLPHSICDECWRSLPIFLRLIDKSGLQGSAVIEYSEKTANFLNAFKERGQRKLGELLAGEIVQLFPRPAADRLVAAPSSAKNFASRGFIPAEVIARTLARAWRLPIERLWLEERHGDQSELDRDHRLSNLVGAMSAKRPLSGQRVLLVDDIVTTGATLIEMARAVREAGGTVVGFVTVAETIPKTRTKL